MGNVELGNNKCSTINLRVGYRYRNRIGYDTDTYPNQVRYDIDIGIEFGTILIYDNDIGIEFDAIPVSELISM